MHALKERADIPSLEHTLACQVGKVKFAFYAVFVSHPYPIAVPRLHRDRVNKYLHRASVSLPYSFLSILYINISFIGPLHPE